MSSLTIVGPNWLQAASVGGNWLQDTANAELANNADWFSGSPGASATDLAANSFASIQQIAATNRNTIAVNTGIAAAAKQLVNKTA